MTLIQPYQVGTLRPLRLFLRLSERAHLGRPKYLRTIRSRGFLSCPCPCPCPKRQGRRPERVSSSRPRPLIIVSSYSEAGRLEYIPASIRDKREHKGIFISYLRLCLIYAGPASAFRHTPSPPVFVTEHSNATTRTDATSICNIELALTLSVPAPYSESPTRPAQEGD